MQANPVASTSPYRGGNTVRRYSKITPQAKHIRPILAPKFPDNPCPLIDQQNFPMPKKFMKRYLPTPEKVRARKSLRFLGDILHEPNLWHINRHSVVRAFLIGIFFTFIPMPFQMLAAVFVAIWFNANLPLSVILVWISNPVTMPPIFYFNYKIGALVLDRPVLNFEFQLSWAWLSGRLMDIGIPLYLGSLLVATISGCVAYLIVQFLWRRKVREDWQERIRARHRRKAARKAARTTDQDS
jgi:uncharacterized protein (DUF2062 family)